MGEDLEKIGSMRHRSSKVVHPILESSAEAPFHLQPPRERRHFPILIILIVIACIAMFAVTMYVNNCPANTANDKCLLKFLHRVSFQPYKENPLLGPSARTLQKLGALDTEKVAHKNQGWRLLSCIWLHGGLIHLAVNMLSLLAIGIKLEQEFGFFKIGIIYLLSGFGGSLLSSLFLQGGVSVGASGAVFGLLGAMLSELITNWTIYESKCCALISLVFLVVVNLAIGIMPLVDNFAHIGGFLVGFLAGFVLLMQPRHGYVKLASTLPGNTQRQSKYKCYQLVLLVIALVILIAGISVTLVLVLRGVDANKKCSWCHYLNCVPTSKWSCNNTGAVSCSTVPRDDSNSIQVTCVSNNHTMLVAANQSESMLQSLCVQLCS